MDGLTRRFQQLHMQDHENFDAERAVVSNTVSDEDATVYVTLPNSESPELRIEVQWRLQVKDNAGTLAPRYPHKNDVGVVFYDDEGDAWLMY